MSIPIIAGPVGYDSWYVKVFRNICEIIGDPKKFVLEWIAPDKELVVHTDRLDDATSYRITSMLDYTVPAGIEVVRYNHHIEVNWRYINKYAECRTPMEVWALKPWNDLTSDKHWCYPLPSLTNAINLFNITDNNITIEQRRAWQEVTSFDVPLLYVENLRNAFLKTKIEECSMNFENATDIAGMFLGGSLKRWRGTFDKYKVLTLTDMFSGCQIDKESVLRYFDNIPDSTCPQWNKVYKVIAGIGIHIDYKQDEEVLAAIANAKAEGWAISVQWNGTPTSTASNT